MIQSQRRGAQILGSAAVAALLTVSLAGCSGGGGGSGGSADAADAVKSSGPDTLAADPLTAVRNAAELTGHAGSAQAATQLTTESANKQASFTGTGTYDYTKRIGRLQVTVPPGAATNGPVVEVVEPGIVFLQNSGAKVPAGKWVKLDVRQLADGNLISNGATDPADAAGALRGVQQAQLVGDDTVDGVAVKHYKGTLDLAKAADATGGAGAYGLRMAANTFTVKAVPYDVWLDAQGRLRRVTEVFTFAGVAGSSNAKDQVKVTSTVTLSGFGQPVNVSEPPAADVVQLQDSSASPQN
ncbi:hypothetical protein ACIGXM_30510 [Kitasatospora sp. NPDC052896]|uniref:hypothetical protein n=1 Tax=Kitasatospora sp. NPDC052896 TaxID=3364061 RepID=UPI0037CAF602